MLDEKPFVGYENGARFWRDNAISFGLDEAAIISRNYLGLNLTCENSSEEKQFCREIFWAMMEASIGKTEPKKLVYPYDFKTANERSEVDSYHACRRLNGKCASGIDELIRNSCYKSNFYNLDLAAMCAVSDYGLVRVSAVLAFNYQFKTHDRRFSKGNRKWADSFSVFEKAIDNTWLDAHPELIDGFCDHVREMYVDSDAERFTLPGKEESGELCGGYEIKRAIIVSDDGNGFLTGYAIGCNPEAVSDWVCWQFTVRNGKRHYNWGIYGERQDAVDAYNARVFVALNKN